MEGINLIVQGLSYGVLVGIISGTAGYGIYQCFHVFNIIGGA